MEERTHGGDIYGLERPVLDLSISLNPLGVPPCAIQAAREALERSPAYPDPLCRGLRRAISARDGVPEDWVLCGNGASDLCVRTTPWSWPRPFRSTTGPCTKIIVKLNSITQICTKISAFPAPCSEKFPRKLMLCSSVIPTTPQAH